VNSKLFFCCALVLAGGLLSRAADKSPASAALSVHDDKQAPILTIEDLLKTICEGSTVERKRAIDLLADAYSSTNRTPEKDRLVGPLLGKVMSRPYNDNPLAKSWFSAVDILIDKLKTDEREKAGDILNHLIVTCWPINYDFWIKNWPARKQVYIEAMNRRKK
jgi:hypothetical protein